MWGFPGFDKKRVIFNARSETALEKRTFRDSVKERRCIVPATGFYEWSEKKDKYFFRSPDHRVLLFAGFYRQYEGTDMFVILTTQANASLEGIHHRMPLILEPGEVNTWMFDPEATDILLHKRPGPLEKEMKGQLSLFESGETPPKP